MSLQRSFTPPVVPTVDRLPYLSVVTGRPLLPRLPRPTSVRHGGAPKYPSHHMPRVRTTSSLRRVLLTHVPVSPTTDGCGRVPTYSPGHELPTTCPLTHLVPYTQTHPPPDTHVHLPEFTAPPPVTDPPIPVPSYASTPPVCDYPLTSPHSPLPHDLPKHRCAPYLISVHSPPIHYIPP